MKNDRYVFCPLKEKTKISPYSKFWFISALEIYKFNPFNQIFLSLFDVSNTF